MFATATVDNTAPMRPLQLPSDVPSDRAIDLDAIVRYRIASSDTLEQSAACLLRLLSGGFAVWEDGRLLEIRVLVAVLNRLTIVIHTREHGPAHFHVLAPGINASFAITDCTLLEGEISGKDRRLIEYWHGAARPTLVHVWNSTRPSGCPVGPIEL
jgi:hypothetical protein